MKEQNHGVTLIELLMIITIIGMVLILIMPAIASTQRQAQLANCMNNIKQLVIAAFIYADEHNETLPNVSETSNYVDNVGVYICPRDTRLDLGIAKPSYTAYKYTPSSLLPSDINGLPSERILYIESDKAGIQPKENITGSDIAYRHNNKTVMSFTDGHIITYAKDQSAQLLSQGRKRGK
jgi:prepilin-type processing-associated H-X9-DG protein